MKKIYSFIITVALLFCSVTAHQPVFRDIAGHWAEEEILRWSENGIINGYGEYFKPDNYITRGEMAVVLDRALKLEKKAENIFSDLDNAFYTDALLKCCESGIIKGFDGEIRPKDKITRQEAVVMLGRAVGAAESAECSTRFSDEGEVAQWAKGYINTFVNSGYMSGSGNKIFARNNITRAEVIKILDKCTKKEETEHKAEPDKIPEYSEEEPHDDYSYEEDDYYVPAPVTEPPVITTTLEDGITVKSSKKSFDVWARDYNNEKIPCKAFLNGTELEPVVDDTAKTGFAIAFADENIGENIVEIRATDSMGSESVLKYVINYEKPQPGDVVGRAIWCVEAFSIGNGYILPPQETDVIEGENTAQALERILKNAGFETEITGNEADGYYLAAILSGTSTINNIPNTPQLLIDKIKEAGNDYETDWVEENRLGEFDFTQGTGWTYSINNVFPNMGFASSCPADGDVIRVQLTLCYGRDSGGSNFAVTAPGDMFFESPDRDALTRLICNKGIENCPQEVIDTATKIDATAEEITAAEEMLR